MKKNVINWKRTPVGSLLEILCPVLLMLLLVWARIEIEPSLLGNINLLNLKKPIYPLATMRND
jgi:hypothetical protein